MHHFSPYVQPRLCFFVVFPLLAANLWPRSPPTRQIFLESCNFTASRMLEAAPSCQRPGLPGCKHAAGAATVSVVLSLIVSSASSCFSLFKPKHTSSHVKHSGNTIFLRGEGFGGVIRGHPNLRAWILPAKLQTEGRNNNNWKTFLSENSAEMRLKVAIPAMTCWPDYIDVGKSVQVHWNQTTTLPKKGMKLFSCSVSKDNTALSTWTSGLLNPEVFFSGCFCFIRFAFTKWKTGRAVIRGYFVQTNKKTQKRLKW